MPNVKISRKMSEMCDKTDQSKQVSQIRCAASFLNRVIGEGGRKSRPNCKFHGQ